MSILETFLDGEMSQARALLAGDPGIVQRDINVAAMLGEYDVVKEMLRNDPSLATAKSGPKGWTPLLYLAWSRFHQGDAVRAANMARTAKLLIEHGASPNSSYIEDNYPDSPQTVLYGATGVTNNPELARVLLEEGARPNDGESIYHAAEANNRECLELLREHGADFSSRGAPWGNTPIYFLLGHHEGTSAAITSTEGIRWLLEHGADPNVPSYDIRETPLHLAVRTGRGIETVEMLLRHGANTELRDSNGRTPYTQAVRSGNAAVAELLLRYGALDETTIADKFLGACARGDSDEAAAIRAEHPNIMELLGSGSGAALSAAAAANRPEAVRVMLESGFDIAAVGEGGATALHHAAWWGNSDVVRLLLEHNPPLEVRDTSYKGTPLDWAVHGSLFSPNKGSAGHLAAAESILAAGAVPVTGMAPSATPEMAEVLGRYGGG